MVPFTDHNVQLTASHGVGYWMHARGTSHSCLPSTVHIELKIPHLNQEKNSFQVGNPARLLTILPSLMFAINLAIITC